MLRSMLTVGLLLAPTTLWGQFGGPLGGPTSGPGHHPTIGAEQRRASTPATSPATTPPIAGRSRGTDLSSPNPMPRPRTNEIGINDPMLNRRSRVGNRGSNGRRGQSCPPNSRGRR